MRSLNNVRILYTTNNDHTYQLQHGLVVSLHTNISSFLFKFQVQAFSSVPSVRGPTLHHTTLPTDRITMVQLQVFFSSIILPYSLCWSTRTRGIEHGQDIEPYVSYQCKNVNLNYLSYKRICSSKARR